MEGGGGGTPQAWEGIFKRKNKVRKQKVFRPKSLDNGDIDSGQWRRPRRDLSSTRKAKGNESLKKKKKDNSVKQHRKQIRQSQEKGIRVAYSVISNV